MHALFDIFGLL